MILCVSASPAIGKGLSGILPSLVDKLPPRVESAMTGSEFARHIAEKHGPSREQAIEEQLISGNIPDFLKQLKPVRLSGQIGNGRTVQVTIFVTPDYLAVGSDKDFLLMPMALHTARRVAAACDCILPTRKMVDAVFRQSDVHLTPETMQAGPAMRTTAYYVAHDNTIKQQRRSVGAVLTALISGHKKDVVLSNRLLHNPGRIAIYGWHRQSGTPIQPLSTVHGAAYADYSHGIRLVSDTVLIDGEPRPIYGVLEDPELASLLTDEGPIKGARHIFTARQSW